MSSPLHPEPRLPDAQRPLAGRRIVVTRARRQAGTLTSGLHALGAEVVELPVIEILPPESYAPLDEALRSLPDYQWLIVTSSNTVRVIGERLSYLGLSFEALQRVKIAAIGSSTAAALQSLGASATLVPPSYVAESLVEALRQHVPGVRVLLARAATARDIIPLALGRLAARLDVVDAYQTMVPDASIGAVRLMFHVEPSGAGRGLEVEAPTRQPDAVTFTSSSTVKHFFQLLNESGAELDRGVRALSIGPVTTATLREHGWEPAAEALQHDVGGLIEAAVRTLA
ncbi:MAG TPA: uroporphyrinogen-III synthase [Acidisarcina sp.]